MNDNHQQEALDLIERIEQARREATALPTARENPGQKLVRCQYGSLPQGSFLVLSIRQYDLLRCYADFRDWVIVGPGHGVRYKGMLVMVAELEYAPSEFPRIARFLP